MDTQIRPSDFQKAWPYAMARAVRETAQLAHLLDVLTVKTDTQLRAVIEFAPLFNELTRAVTERHEAAIARSSQAAVEKIEEAQAAFLDSQIKFLAKFDEERLSLSKTREVLDDQSLEISRRQKELETARSKFNSMGLFMRIFKRV